MWQQMVVGLVVAAALLHVCLRYLPLDWRRRIVHALSRKGLRQERLAALLKTQASCADGCASCGACEDAPAAGDTPARSVIKLHVQR